MRGRRKEEERKEESVRGRKGGIGKVRGRKKRKRGDDRKERGREGG